MKKGIFHVHTHHSVDSWVSPRKIVESAIAHRINYLVISDHDSLQGSIDAKNYAKQQGYDIAIPVAGEFLTDIGDVIVVNVPETFEKIHSHRELCLEAKRAGGYTILPHPYDHHKLDKIEFSLIDMIEVYNSRTTMEKSMASLQLALDLNKPMIYGADAHFLKDLCNATFFYTGDHPFKGINYPATLTSTPLLRKDFSQLIRSWKLKSPKLAMIIFKRILKRTIWK